VRGIDTPVAIFTGSYQELNAFEHAFHRARRAAKESESIRPALPAFKPFDLMPGEKAVGGA
jgi:hypothetical protein